MKVTIDELLQHTPFHFNKVLKVHKKKRNSISAGQIDIMIALAHITGEYEDPKGVVFL